MSDRLISVGLDVGTTSTQMVVSELEIENRSGSFSVPNLQITDRKICYRSPVHFTPLLDESRVDGEGLKTLVAEEYARAGLTPKKVDTGAVIITGETSRKENAKTVLESLAEFAGEFVVATAGPDLESVLAARGAGAVEYSRETGETVLHMDIGGGTSNLALIRDGVILSTGCLNVGGRLLKFDDTGKILYVSPVVKGLCDFSPGETATEDRVKDLAELLVSALEMAAGLRPATELLTRLTTENTDMQIPKNPVTVSFSGGVADCIEKELPFLQFGDMGSVLGQAIRRSRLCKGKYRLGEETIRATVIGAGCHSTQLSGSTVYYQNISFPLKNLPVVCLPKKIWDQPADALRAFLMEKYAQSDGPVLLALQGQLPREYAGIKALAQIISGALGQEAAYLALEADAAKALGQAICSYLPVDTPCLCLDNLYMTPESYLDVGMPVGPAVPVVIKTLVFEK